MTTPSIETTFAGKHLVATGVTGFLGKVWLAMTLDRLDVDRITLVIRGKKGQSAEDRFTEIFEASPVFRPLRERLGQGLRDLIAQKVRVVESQLTKPMCGLDPKEAQAMMRDADAVVHFAGLTDFEPDPQWAIDANIHGARHAADLAALSPRGRYVHVSTTFVAGNRTGEIDEAITPGVGPTGVTFDPQAELEALEAGIAKLATKKQRIDFAMARGRALGWPNIYTFTKGLSEHLLETREDVTTTTFRPAIVECARSYPFKGWNEGINTSGPIVWLLSTSFQRFPAKATNHFDIVPVDTVARSMMVVIAAALRDDAQSVYQCGSSHSNPFTFGRAVDLCGLAVRKLHKDSDDRFERVVVPRLDPVCYDPDRPQVLGFRRMREAAKATRRFLREFDLSESISPKLYEKLDGKKIDEKLRKTSMDCRTTDRKLGQVDEMLRQYRPFIHDLNYTFVTQNLLDATAALSEEDRALYGFDVDSICWRNYWLNVQVPGLDKWSLPLLRGDKVYNDEPLPPRTNERRTTGTHSREDVEAEIRATA